MRYVKGGSAGHGSFHLGMMSGARGLCLFQLRKTVRQAVNNPATASRVISAWLVWSTQLQIFGHTEAIVT